ncbi:exocyst complex component 1-like [Halichondria panicea]|uniref:exocyst complex component 1-like n=1 Tax=Halichondria panicea TaxID=6063 RepID=UPI00312BC4B6
MENLTEELAQLDQGNIHSLMDSESQIQELMERLDQGVVEIDRMDMKMNVYDQLLGTVRDAMGKLGGQYSHILCQNSNLKSLFAEVEGLVTQLDLDPRVEEVLLHESLSSPSEIRDCELAAASLQSSLQQELPSGVDVLQAVTEQTEAFHNLSAAFGRRLYTHLSGLFTLNAAMMLDNAHVRHTVGPSITSHSQVHSDLLGYSKLMCWLKECEPVRFSEVLEAYLRSFRPVYEEEIRAVFAESKTMLGRVSEGKKGLLGRTGSNMDMLRPISGSMMMLSHARDKGGINQSFADFGATAGLSPDHPNKPRFDQVFDTVLEQLQPVCVSEQKFLTSFFHFAKRTASFVEDDDINEVDGLDGPLRDDSDLGLDGVQGVLGQLLAILLPEIEAFIAHGERMDSYNALHLLVNVSQRLMFALESGGRVMSYLDETLKKALLYIKRLFDKLIVNKRRQIEDMKVPRGAKAGVLPCVLWFKDFAERAESIVMGTDRRADLDKAYQTLTDALFKTIDRVATEHQKTPNDVIKFENYHTLVDILSRLKINCLEVKRDTAKKRYRSHKKIYVKNCLGRPLDKLSAFFEGVESLRAAGTKAEEVGYRLDYSRSELRKCIKEYPGKEVKRGLEKLYRRVEKEVSDSDLQVVWGAMQEAFIEQAQRFEALIAECYPGANISLDFTLDNLAEYFASISAQK